jgi:TetR/AcrR family transcriptional regulator, mexCD-oprJ operon repressor
MPTPAPDHRRVIADRNIEAILDAAERILERRSEPSIAAIAAEAGLSRVTVYSHFLNLDAILEAVVARAVKRTMALFDQADIESGSALEALERLLALGWQELDRNRARTQTALRLLTPAALARSHEAARARVQALVERGRSEGTFRTDLPAEWLVDSFTALVHAAAEQLGSGRSDAATAQAVVTATIRDLFTKRNPT